MTVNSPSSDAPKQTPVRVCVLNSSYENSNACMKEYDNFLCTPEYWLREDPHYTFTHVEIHKNSAYSQIRSLVNSHAYDVFFNLCDGAKDEDRAGISVIEALEEFKVPFTGSDSGHFEPSKIEMKMLAFYAGIQVPPFARVTAHDDLVKACSNLKFPMIVKHVSGYGSIGMSKDSKCRDFEALEKEARRFIDAFGEVLVEEFIEGVEVNVLAFEDLDGSPTRVLEPIQMLFPEGETFKHFDCKWKGCMFPVKKIDDPALRLKLQQIGLTAFEHILGGVGFGRSDLRVCSKTGELYFLEINPNCGCFYPRKDGTADLIMEVDEMKHAGVARHFIQAAINRNKRLLAQESPCSVVFHPQKGYHVCAKRDIQDGEVVFRDESSSFRLVTKSHVAKSWNALDKQVFAQYAWPMSKEVFVTWSSDFRAWRPINHSCSPNLWFGENHSLNVYARRAITSGEELTMDYATFCSGPLMHSFTCQCGSSNCRKQITPLDYNQRYELREEYGTRVTDYIYDGSQNTAMQANQ